MTGGDYLALIALHFVRQLPVLLVGIIGIFFAVGLRQRARRASVWACWGFALLIGHAIANVARDVAVAAIRSNVQVAPEEIGVMITIWSVPPYLALIGAMVLLARAVFVDRGDIPRDLRESVQPSRGSSTES